MTIQARFGKKLSVPSTAEIKHELRLMEAGDRMAAAATAADRGHIIDDLASRFALSRDRAAMLADRFGIERGALDGAAQQVVDARA